MSRPRRPPGEPEFVEVACVQAGTLVVLRVTRDVLEVCRQRGWMVWDDLVRSAQVEARAQGDGDTGWETE